MNSGEQSSMDRLLSSTKVHIQTVLQQIHQYNEDAKRDGKPTIPIDDELRQFLSDAIIEKCDSSIKAHKSRMKYEQNRRRHKPDNGFNPPLQSTMMPEKKK